MDWELAINRNRDALLRVVAILFARIGLMQGKIVTTIPRHLHSALYRILRPAESALRRLIIVEAREMALPARAASAVAVPPIAPIGKGTGVRIPAFRLFDPRKWFEECRTRPKYAKGPGPRIFFFDGFDPVIEPIEEKKPILPDDPMDAAGLCRRLLSLQHALDDLPRQARRLVRARARRSAGFEPMRPGWPPGHRARHVHVVDEILSDCDSLARYALEPPEP